ncbi:MAG TPA: hypothetical protein VGR19_12745 [Allosphingosinicella sp.]|nr:hypothetical protein [Allosphingosinicella sp.]
MSGTFGRFRPTLKMASNARIGLRLREQFGRGGTEVGVRRAQQLAERRELEPSDIKSMYSYFARHEVNKNTTRYRWARSRTRRPASSPGSCGAARKASNG